MKLRWLARAQRHLLEIHAYIAADNKTAARGVIKRIQTAAPLLARHPQAGRTGRVEGTREFPIPGTPYMIVYRIHGKEAQILAIQHGAQQWPDEAKIDAGLQAATKGEFATDAEVEAEFARWRKKQ